VCAMDQSMGMQNFQILADRDLGSVEFAGHVRDQYPAIVIKGLNNCPPAFFVEHVSSVANQENRKSAAFDCTFFLYRLLSFVQSNVMPGGGQALSGGSVAASLARRLIWKTRSLGED
jgi:hypothetical protein